MPLVLVASVRRLALVFALDDPAIAAPGVLAQSNTAHGDKRRVVLMEDVFGAGAVEVEVVCGIDRKAT